MKIFKSAVKPLVLALTIVVMAGVYYHLWIARPDYFRVQSGVNLLPLNLVEIAREYSAYSDSKPLPDMLLQQGEEKAVERIEEIYAKLQQVSVSLTKHKSDYDKRLRQDAEEHKSFETSQWLQFNLFISQKTTPFVNQINAIDDRMQAILTASGVKSADDLPSGQPAIQYANLRVERAKIELQRTKAELDAREYGMHHLTDFQLLPPQKEYLARNKELEDVRNSLSAEQEAIPSLRGDLYDAFLAYRAATEHRLGYADFLYFSVGAATTATFGDISPNSTIVRMLVCLQVLGSIVFVGLMVNELAGRLNRTAAARA